MFFDPVYLLFVLPGLLLSLIASLYVKGTFASYSQRYSASGLTGAEAADRMLRNAGVYDVRIQRIGGFLSDHYDPSCKTLRLSPDVYGSTSIAAIGVACHEAGHALQHARQYPWLSMRSSLVPVVSIGSNFAYIVFILGFIFQMTAMVYLGCALFGLSVLFAIVTLPVEWDASARAKQVMAQSGMLSRSETAGAASVLNAAFMTYVASAVTAVLTLLYYLYRAGLLGNRRR